MPANTETLLPPNADSNDQLRFDMSLQPALQQVQTEVRTTERDSILQNLLGTDYEFARDSGLIDAFYVNPETGADGLLHMLSGSVTTGPNGAQIPGGFHHEPSAINKDTFVDHNYLQALNSNSRRNYRQFPYEQYEAPSVVINGLQKLTLRTTEDGEKQLVPSHSNMFPKEYDALTIIRTTVRARDTRDTSKDKLDTGINRIVSEGSAVMLDGKTRMKMRLILEADSQKIITAFPLRNKRGSAMNLSEDEAYDLIYN